MANTEKSVKVLIFKARAEAQASGRLVLAGDQKFNWLFSKTSSKEASHMKKFLFSQWASFQAGTKAKQTVENIYRNIGLWE